MEYSKKIRQNGKEFPMGNAQEIYLDVSIEDDDKTGRDSENIFGNLSEDKEALDFLNDDIDWDDSLLDSVFEVKSIQLKVQEESHKDESSDRTNNISTLEIDLTSKKKKKKRSISSKKTNPICDLDKSMNDNEEVSDEKKLEKRAYWRQARKVFLRKKLIVPADDERRDILKLFAHYFNSHQVNKLHEHFLHHTEDGGESLVFRQNLHQLREDGNFLFYFMPKIIEIKGLDNYMKFSRNLINCGPDMTAKFSNVIIRNRLDGSVIMADVVYEGTPTFHILVRNILRSALTHFKGEEEEEESDRKRVKLPSSEILDEVVISDLSSSLEKIEIDENSTGNSKKVEFSQGRLRNPNEISSYRGIGVVRCHLSREKKLYLIEVDITKIEKTGEPETTSTGMSMYRWATNIGNNMANFLQYNPQNN